MSMEYRNTSPSRIFYIMFKNYLVLSPLKRNTDCTDYYYIVLRCYLRHRGIRYRTIYLLSHCAEIYLDSLISNYF